MVEIMMWPVRSEHYIVLAAKQLHQLHQIAWIIRLFNRLSTKVKTPDIGTGFVLQEGDLTALLRVFFIQPPHDERYPGKASLRERDFESRKPYWDARCDHADQVGHHGKRMG